jgi:hypothetical protein
MSQNMGKVQYSCTAVQPSNLEIPRIPMHAVGALKRGRIGERPAAVVSAHSQL